MKELRRQLRRVVRDRYGNSQRSASLAVGANPNLIGGILDTDQVPKLVTLRKLAEGFGFDICDVVRWTLDLPGRDSDRPEADPLSIIDGQLGRLGFDEPGRDAYCLLIQSTAPRGPKR